MNRLSITVAAALAAGLLLSSHAVSAGGMKSATHALTDEEKQQFMQLDTDGDGLISIEEATNDPMLATEFSNVDSNQDNKLDEAEFARFEVTETSD